MKENARHFLPSGTDHPRRNRKFDIRNISVVYSHFFLVSCVLVMSIIMLYVSNRISLNTLTEKNLNDLQYRLEQNCGFISDTFGEAYSIPSVIEQTRYYSYLRGENSGYLPDKYVAVLGYLGQSLQVPNYLSRDSEECLVYLRGTNSVCGKDKVFIEAEDCFTGHMLYEQTPSEDILEVLRSKNGLRILPMETVKVGTSSPKRQLTVIICDSSVPISVLCTYSEEALLDHLEIDSLPSGTHFQIVADNGTVLETYPEAVSSAVVEESYELHAKLPFLKAAVTMWIPRSSFAALLQPSVLASWLIILATALVGFGLSILLAKVSVKPLRELVSRHTDQTDPDIHPNEIRQLGNLLDCSRAEASAMEKVLLSNLLIRVFTGAVLSKEDVGWLKQQLGWEGIPCRVALFNIDENCNRMQVAARLSEALGPFAHCHPVSEWEIGMLLQDGEVPMRLLQEEICTLEQLLSENSHYIYGGISGPMEDLNHFHIAVRQARASIVRHEPLSVFSGHVTYPRSSVTWLQHERLYQDILIGDKENAQIILDEIAGTVHSYSTCKEIFYTMRFVLQCAANELDLKYDPQEIPKYELDVPAWENVKKLGPMLDALFVHMEDRQTLRQAGALDQILLWIENNYSDPNLSIVSVSEQFGISQKRIYALVWEATGVRFNEYVLNLRMKRACALLCTSQLSVEQIAEQSGYSAESTFYRVFKKYFGVTPRQYRQCGGNLKQL